MTTPASAPTRVSVLSFVLFGPDRGGNPVVSVPQSLNHVVNILLFLCGRRVVDNLNVVIAMGDTDGVVVVRGGVILNQLVEVPLLYRWIPRLENPVEVAYQPLKSSEFVSSSHFQ